MLAAIVGTLLGIAFVLFGVRAVMTIPADLATQASCADGSVGDHTSPAVPPQAGGRGHRPSAPEAL
jgi:hypothetical protein